MSRFVGPVGPHEPVHDRRRRTAPESRRGLRQRLQADGPVLLGRVAAHTDTYHGRFAKLVPDECVVEIDEFETDDPALRGEMTISVTLADAEDGTEIVVRA